MLLHYGIGLWAQSHSSECPLVTCWSHLLGHVCAYVAGHAFLERTAGYKYAMIRLSGQNLLVEGGSVLKAKPVGRPVPAYPLRLPGW